MTYYTEGRRIEYKVMAKLKEMGYEMVLRTAGSHSPWDVISYKSDPPHSLWIQVKSGNKKYIDHEKKKWLDCSPTLAPYHHCELWCHVRFAKEFEIVKPNNQ
jgi:Holliday junction resolvase